MHVNKISKVNIRQEYTSITILAYMVRSTCMNIEIRQNHDVGGDKIREIDASMHSQKQFALKYI